MADTNTPPATGPLSGVRVLDMTINVLGPVASQILGDMGADVIKVESPEGDQNRYNGPGKNPGMGVFYLIMNRNKRSIRLDMKRPECHEAFMKLVDGSDVFLHSMRPATADRLGIGYEALSSRNPKIIYAHAPGYRGDGPKWNHPAFDDVIQGESGLASMNAREDQTPRYFPTVIVDKFCGYALASAVSMALFHRERTGEGQLVQVPMMETILQFNLFEHLWEGAIGKNNGKGLGYTRMFSEHRRPYRTLDGYICVLAVNDIQWKKLMAAIGRSEVLEDPKFSSMTSRMANVNLLYGMLADAISEHTTQHWNTVFSQADIPHGPVNQLNDLMNDPYLAETGYFQRHEHPTEGELVMTSIPQYFSRSPGNIRRMPPSLGEHSEEILTEAGYSEAEIARILGT